MTVQPRSSWNNIIAVIVIAAIVIIAAFLLLPRSGQQGGTSGPTASATASASEEPSESPSESASSEPSEASPSSSTGGGELEIEASDFAFKAPAETAAGTTRIVVHNVGKEDHQAQVARIADGKSFADLTAALQQSDPAAALSLLTLSGGPTGVVPGATVATTSALAPGQYAFLCFLESADGVPHIAKGMIAPLEVTGSADDSALPSGDAELALRDFAFDGAARLSAGKHVVTVRNAGPQPHEATLVKLADGKTVEDVEAFVKATEPSGAPPWSSAGGIAGIAPDSEASMDVDVQAGEYAFICFIPDRESGTSHAALGMVAGLTVE